MNEHNQDWWNHEEQLKPKTGETMVRPPAVEAAPVSPGITAPFRLVGALIREAWRAVSGKSA